MSEYKVPHLALMVVEFRVLPLRRFIKDTIYWAWISLWIAAPIDFLWSLQHIPFMAGCRGYFEWRDGIEYPAIGRWHRGQWRRWRAREFPALA